ncbi:hypothetical protein QQM79_09215 [Marinobacteraceae bacterium S3BR75-40.1]
MASAMAYGDRPDESQRRTTGIADAESVKWRKILSNERFAIVKSFWTKKRQKTACTNVQKHLKMSLNIAKTMKMAAKDATLWLKAFKWKKCSNYCGVQLSMTFLTWVNVVAVILNAGLS